MEDVDEMDDVPNNANVPSVDVWNVTWLFAESSVDPLIFVQVPELNL
ncbi:MAG: hypothetical protein P4L33_16660 [Capsulimonadaceae bacterium]|nr:hypothetical protein [Capsulimonadaceae bacterium]